MSNIQNVLHSALCDYLEKEGLHNNIDKLRKLHHLFYSEITDCRQALASLADLTLDYGVYVDSETEGISASLFIGLGVTLRNNLTSLNLALDGLEKVNILLSKTE